MLFFLFTLHHPALIHISLIANLCFPNLLLCSRGVMSQQSPQHPLLRSHRSHSFSFSFFVLQCCIQGEKQDLFIQFYKVLSFCICKLIFVVKEAQFIYTTAFVKIYFVKYIYHLKEEPLLMKAKDNRSITSVQIVKEYYQQFLHKIQTVATC